MVFIKYQHIERLGTDEVEGIEFGESHVFPKIDGSNGCIWMDDGDIFAGSRRRLLTLEDDNAGFFDWVLDQGNIYEYLHLNPTHRLYGEWLVPHSLKTYRESSWQKFYVFDVAVEKDKSEIKHEGDSLVKYLHYDEYKPLLEEWNINYIPPICTIVNGSYEQYIKQLSNNVFLIEDGRGVGEGIVIKNYNWFNKFGRQTWAKIVTSEFKEKHAKEMGGHVVKGKRLIEEEIAQKYVTESLCKKVLSKIKNEDRWSSKYIPRLLNTVYYDVVKEDCWNFVKEHKNPNINFKTLQHFVFIKVKEQLQEVF